METTALVERIKRADRFTRSGADYLAFTKPEGYSFHEKSALITRAELLDMEPRLVTLLDAKLDLAYDERGIDAELIKLNVEFYAQSFPVFKNHVGNTYFAKSISEIILDNHHEFAVHFPHNREKTEQGCIRLRGVLFYSRTLVYGDGQEILFAPGINQGEIDIPYTWLDATYPGWLTRVELAQHIGCEADVVGSAIWDIASQARDPHLLLNNLDMTP